MKRAVSNSSARDRAASARIPSTASTAARNSTGSSGSYVHARDPVEHGLGRAADAIDDHGASGRHRLDGDDPEVLDRREDERQCSLEECAHELVGDMAEHVHRHVGCGSERLEPLAFWVRSPRRTTGNARAPHPCATTASCRLYGTRRDAAIRKPLLGEGLEDRLLGRRQVLGPVGRRGDRRRVDRRVDDAGITIPGAPDPLAHECAVRGEGSRGVRRSPVDAAQVGARQASHGQCACARRGRAPTGTARGCARTRTSGRRSERAESGVVREHVTARHHPIGLERRPSPDARWPT